MPSTTLQIHARRYDTGEPVRISIAGQRIASVEPAWPAGKASDWPFVAPGLFDLQVNGYGGHWFSDVNCTPDQVAQAIRPYLAAGVTRLCPTLVTNSFEALRTGFAAVRTACEQDPWIDRMVPGCHLEGPYLSGDDGPRGAHPRQHIRPADWNEFLRLQEVAGGRIKLVTIAPEVTGAVPFIRQAVAHGVTIAIGHTGANADQIRAAVDAGATLSTHLGNGSHPILRRHPNYIWDQLAEPRLVASIISDGHHLPASVVRSIIRAKGTRGVVITCDAAGWAGCAPGMYQNDLAKVEILPSGKIVVAGQDAILAGSSATTDTCVLLAREYAGVSLGEAFDMASANTSRVLGCEEVGLKRGSRADLVVFSDPNGCQKLPVLATLCCGEVRYGNLPRVAA